MPQDISVLMDYKVDGERSNINHYIFFWSDEISFLEGFLLLIKYVILKKQTNQQMFHELK